MYYCCRLHRGDDLKASIIRFCQSNGIDASAIVTAVGCLYQATIRLADGKTVKQFNNRYEIVSLTGTISLDGAHLHISISDEAGMVIGGHLCENSYVNTTCEIVLVSLDDQYSFSREFDEETGYKELVIRKKEEVKC